MKSILIIATNVGKYVDPDLKTGLWLSELTHIYKEATDKGWAVTIASPKGGVIPIDPESLKPLMLDKISKQYYNAPDFMALLNNSKNLADVKSIDYDSIYLAGGHGTMYDFPDCPEIQEIVRNQYQANKNVTAICHGVGGLLNVKLTNGEFLIKGKSMTGFDWFEEKLAGRKDEVPFNLEEAIKERGANLKKALIPMTSNTVIDGNLITGQNPFSSKETAKVLIEELSK